MNVFVCVYVRIRTRTYMCVCTYVCVNMYVCMCIYVYVCMYAMAD